MASKTSYQAVLEKYKPNLNTYEQIYKHFHQNPELSTLEHETAGKIAEHLKSLSPDLDVRTGIGGTGLIAIAKNGKGPTVLLRADMDGLPIKEKTGLDYASTKTMRDYLDNKVKPVMHACGHDFHITCNLGAADVLLKARNEWSGTVVFLFQPAEERGCGSQQMIEDGLYDPKRHACPIPDVLLGQHVFPLKPGNVGTRPGSILCAADSYRITIYGKGGHGSMPHRCIDPVLIASNIVVRLQSIVSREVPPEEIAVVTVGSLNAGDAVNVISDEATLQVNIRSMTEEWRHVILDGVKRIVNSECEASKSPKPAVFERLSTFPVTSNNRGVTETVQNAFDASFGDRHEILETPISGSEDFQNLAKAVDKPSVFWAWGGPDPAVWAQHEKEGTLGQLPVNHSAYFAPGIHPTLQAGIDNMVVGALAFVGKEGK